MTEVTAAPGRGDVDSNLALLGYFLLMGSVLFAGLPGLAAVVLAYVQRDVAGPAVRSHFNYQIRIFWVALALTLIAALSALGALAVGVGQLVDFSMHGQWDGWDAIAFDGSEIRIDPAIILLLGVTAAALLAATFWVVLAPVVGLIRLASQRGMGDRAA